MRSSTVVATTVHPMTLESSDQLAPIDATFCGVTLPVTLSAYSLDMQKCRVCEQVKPLTDFGFKHQARGTRHKICKACFALYRREHYQLNRASYIERNTRNFRTRRYEFKQRLLQFLLDHPCVDCGEDDPVVLEFDHDDPSKKLDTMYAMVQRGFGWAAIEIELAKCVVRCANCHRRRTAQQFNWPKLQVDTPYAFAARRWKRNHILLVDLEEALEKLTIQRS